MTGRNEDSVLLALVDLRRSEADRVKREEAEREAEKERRRREMEEAARREREEAEHRRLVVAEEARLRVDLEAREVEAGRRIEALRQDLLLVTSELKVAQQRLSELGNGSAAPRQSFSRRGWALSCASALGAAVLGVVLFGHPAVVPQRASAPVAAAVLAAPPPPVAPPVKLAAMETAPLPSVQQRTPRHHGQRPQPRSPGLAQIVAACGDDPICDADGHH